MSTTDELEQHQTDAGLEAAQPDQDEAGNDRGAKETDDLRFRRSHFYALIAPLTFVAGLAAGYLFWGRTASPATPPAQAADPPAVAQEQPSGPTRFEISVDDDPSLGPEDAPITIVEFSDFNCPFCRKWHLETFNELLAAYPEQIRFVYRDLPVVGGGAVGLGAAVAANCAGEQDAYWDYHQALFSGAYAMDSQGFQQYATDLNLAMDEFQECVEDDRQALEVQNDLRYGASLGITGTPTFFINGIPVVGAQPLQVFINVIESELNS